MGKASPPFPVFINTMNIVWVESHYCNYKCPYCSIHKLDKCVAIDWNKWVERLNSLNPQVIDITGGEPFLNPHMIDIIKGLNCKVGLTTNMSRDLTRLAQEVSPDKLFSITASYHPTQNINRDWFTGKIVMLMQRGFHVTVNFVAYPEQMYLIPSLQAYFQAFGIPFHVDPYAEDKDYPYTFNEREKSFLRPFTAQNRLHKIDNPISTIMCSAGMDYLNIHPDGTVYRCMTNCLSNYGSMGNLFDEGFKINTDMELCDHFGLCGGCDMDKARMEKPKVAV